ncbi:GSCFA domain-containing protein [Aestuariibaculum sediminum]|uniref:GSCFA domain-containing protein n=1 Tax=Aestuariibaculum sediminum TaxID=2770637 RepID=A0A8J6Q938_9FLAO|nr:GSCFA domain-containing protein [Aestuariibaculum sediminum]MBD0833628.1 GSCFA domain-containing protein [Aestuariibaculum sediminum]
MNFQTTIPLKEQIDNRIDYHSSLLLLGSCFVENIGEKFSYYKFKSLQNPFGILFNPVSVETLVRRAVQEDLYSDNDLIFQNERWHCFDAHSNLSDSSKQEVITALNSAINLTHKCITNATHIIVTLGTAWVYRNKETQAIVANCHKVPQRNFDKVLLSVDEVYQSIKGVVEEIHRINPNVTIMFTVSPVRHIKDGFIENTQSKAHLISGIHQLLGESKSSKHDALYYFPSFEIMMDELRDYRFYTEDMLHPNKVAIQHIWERFCRVWVSKYALPTMGLVDDIQKGLRHKPFNPNSEAHKVFLERLESKKKLLQSEFEHIKF